MTQQFRDSFYSLAPPWLSTDNAEKYLYVLELMRDCLLEKANEAVKIRLPGQGDASQLPYLAFDRVLEQGPAESNESFVGRLQTAFPTWAKAGSAPAVLLQLQAYAQNLQPGVPAAYPEMAIVSNPRNGKVAWNTIYQGQAVGSAPSLMTVPTNFNWDGNNAATWRCWLVLYMAAVAVAGLSGTAAATSTASGGSFTSPGQNVGGVWVPTTSGTAVNAPFLTVTGLSGLTAANNGQMLTLSGSAHSGNNGTFPIAGVLTATSCVIANPNGVANDAGPLTWSVSEYPWIGPGPAWGTPNTVWGQGELTIPAPGSEAADTIGQNVGGVWRTAAVLGAGMAPSLSWGLDVESDVIVSLRQLVKKWKSAGTYYPNIIVAFDGGDGTTGKAYSPLSSEGSGNPDGTFGSVGKNVGGVWVPSRAIASPFDCYCAGTGVAVDCSVENMT